MCVLNTSGLWSETFGTCTRDSGSLQSLLVPRLKAPECQGGGSAGAAGAVCPLYQELSFCFCVCLCVQPNQFREQERCGRTWCVLALRGATAVSLHGDMEWGEQSPGSEMDSLC